MAEVEVIKTNLKTETEKIVNYNTKKVCAYCRVSTDSEEQITSYESQIKYYSEKIKTTPNWEFVGIYADEGISGTQVKNRVEFQRMIDDAKIGKIDIIITKSISRFARNVVDTLKYIRELRELKIDVYFEKENIHTLDLDSEMFLTFYSAFAQAESESTSQNVKMGLRAKMKRGEYVGHPECYGFNWNKQTKELEINDEQAEIIIEIFNLYISGIGSYTISNMLNEKGIKAYRGGKWHPTQIRDVLNNEKYVGDLLSQKSYVDNPLTHKHIKNFGEKEKYYVKNHHQGIISRETWNKVQEIYSKRSNQIIPNGKTHGSKYSKKYPFSSKIECGVCGMNYVRRCNGLRKDGTKKNYWACADKVRCEYSCSNTKFIRDELLQNIFIELYNTIIKDKYKTKDKLLNAIKETLIETNNYKTKINELKLKEETLRKRLSNLIDMKLDDCISKEDYKEKEKEIKDNLESISLKKQELEKVENDNKNISNKIKEIENIFTEPILLKEFNKEAFDSLVDKIIIGEKDSNGNINYKVIRFILKIGNEYVYNINDNKSVSFRPNKPRRFTNTR